MVGSTMNMSYRCEGGLPGDHPSYVKRQADADLYENLTNGKFCYVFNSRQMGKTSLLNRAIKQLSGEGTAYAKIDLSPEGKVTIEQWYTGIVRTLVRDFHLANPTEFLQSWWQERKSINLSPVQRLAEFLRTVLLKQIQSPIVIFIDEIDSVLSLEFETDDFFALLRSCHEERALRPEYNRLTFALVGVATPSDLMRDTRRTPFNIGYAVELSGFQLDEVEDHPLTKGLEGKAENPQAVMKEILHWSGGQPFLTQKICELLVQRESPILQGKESEQVKSLIQRQIIENWKAKDSPVHLTTISDRLLRQDEKRTARLLGLYQQILQEDGIVANKTVEQRELQLSGLVVEENGKLRVYNPIYKKIFNLDWIKNQLSNLCPYAEDLRDWLDSECKDESRLLRGEKLKEAWKWSKGKSLSDEHDQFLSASTSQEEEELKIKEARKAAEQRNRLLSKAKKKAESRTRIGSGILVLTLLGAAFSVIWAVHLQDTLLQQKQMTAEENKNLSLLSDLSKKLQNNGKQEAADAARRQLVLSQGGKIEKNRDLQQALLLSNTALAYHNLGDSQEAEAAIKDSMKRLRNRFFKNSPLKKQVLIYSLYVQGEIYKNKDKQTATKAYKEAFDLLQSNSNQFNPLNLKTEIITFNTIQAVHLGLIELLEIEPAQNNDLLSEVRISRKLYFYADYVELENLLQNKDWKRADDKTTEMMWKIADRQQETGLRVEDFSKFPCSDLQDINDLWEKYSDKHFGFGVQRRIWREVDGNLGKFVDRVGWGQRDKDGSFFYWRIEGQPFDLSIPEGKLPWAVTYYGGNDDTRKSYMKSLSSCFPN
jgi:AAA-like domain/GUN4-like